MKTRRDFVKLAATATLLGATGTRVASAASTPPTTSGAAPTDDRAYWTQIAARLATPVLEALSRRQLKATMPVEANPASPDRPQFSHLEALGRLLAGLAPWLELAGDATPEGQARARFAALARAGLDAATDPASPDFLNFSQGQQPLVDAAFLAQALLRAPVELWQKLEPRVRQNVAAALRASRPIQPPENNWNLFATIIEVAVYKYVGDRDEARLVTGLKKFQEWYVGDGCYGDGPEFHWDYYNSFVIHPMLVEALDIMGGESEEWRAFRGKVHERFIRFAAIQERLIAPDGSYPVIGRSIAYRCGAFHALALASLRHMLPTEVLPGQARAALTSVIRKTLEAPGTFDEHGWLRIGLAGHQPGLGETYISTGSLYLCSFALLPLGLPATDPFWSTPAAKTTWQKVWSGENLPADHAIKSPR
jgi:hypothetical protein